MLELIIKLVIFTVMPISGFFAIKNLIDSDEKIYSVKNILILIGLCITNELIYTSDYRSYTTILNVGFLVVGYKYIFKISFFQSLLLSICMMLLLSFSELILYTIIYLPFDIQLARNYSIQMLINNIGIGLMINIIANIKFIKKIITNLYVKLGGFTKFETAVVSIFWIIIINLLCYIIFKTNFVNIPAWIGVSIEFVFLMFMFNYFRDKDRYIGLNERFDDLYEYVQTMEESLDNEQMNIHEYKNQLSVIRSMTNNKKIKDYIDSLVDECPDDATWNTEL